MCPLSQCPAGPGTPTTALAAIRRCCIKLITKFETTATATDTSTNHHNEEMFKRETKSAVASIFHLSRDANILKRFCLEFGIRLQLDL